MDHRKMIDTLETYHTLTEFLRSQLPTFSDAREPLDADDWLRALERKFAALHVPAAEQVNFATYLLNGLIKAIFKSSRCITFLDCTSLGEDSHDAPPYTKMGKALIDKSSRGLECWSIRT